MKAYDVDAATELLKEQAADVWFIEIILDSGTYRYNTSDIDLYYDEEKYESVPLSIGDIGQTSGFSIDNITFTLANTDNSLAALLLNEDVLNKSVNLYHQMISTSTHQAVGAGVHFFAGFIDDWSFDKGEGQLTLANETALWNKKTLRLPKASCRWVFKSTECGYSGSGSCDQSWTRCGELGNQARFEGRRFINTVENKVVYWGRNPK